MQDIQHSTDNTAGGGGGVRLFAVTGTGTGTVNRHLRPPHNHHHDLKCPRCDSSNTKFCYYNNYNLSQPRHFCKSCRRYWTNGGVLRNVPVGGGVRKAKRSSSTKPKSKTTVSNIYSSNSAVASDPLDPDHLGRGSTNSENSSSDSCSRSGTATATANATPIATAAEASGSNSTNSTQPKLINFNESSATRLFGAPRSQSQIETVDPVILRSWSTDDHQLPFQKAENVEMQRDDVKMAGNWEENVDDHDEGIFDQAYWSGSQWNDDDHNHLLNYLP